MVLIWCKTKPPKWDTLDDLLKFSFGTSSNLLTSHSTFTSKGQEFWQQKSTQKKGGRVLPVQIGNFTNPTFAQIINEETANNTTTGNPTGATDLGQKTILIILPMGKHDYSVVSNTLVFVPSGWQMMTTMPVVFSAHPRVGTLTSKWISWIEVRYWDVHRCPLHQTLQLLGWEM